jgi:hypothetical protein
MIKIAHMLLIFVSCLLPLQAANTDLIEKNLAVEEREIYLVVVYNVSRDVPAPMSRMQFEATIVKVVRGRREFGRKIKFSRVYEKVPADIDKYEGGMFYVVYDKSPMNGSPKQGQLYVDAQHPERFFKYSSAKK